MDVAAVSLARDHSIPIIVFNLGKRGAFADIICGGGLYTTIYN